MMQVLQQMLWQMITLVSTPVFWLMAAVVYWQIRRRARKTAEAMLYLPGEPVLSRTVYTVLAGLAGGLLASWLLLLLGVSVEYIGFGPIWIVALLLMFVQQRFFCFAYAGGIVAVIHCLTGWPNVQVSSLLAMVAVLHCTEAFLVLMTGHFSAVPVYWDRERDIFQMQMTWPLPLVMLTLADGSVLQPQAGFAVFPDFWPVLGGAAEKNGTHLYQLMPMLAALSYQETAVNCTAEQKTRRSAMLLLLYSGCLLLLVLWTDGRGVWQMVPALFAPLGHEGIIALGKRDAYSSNGNL